MRIKKVRAGGSFTLSKVDFSQFVKVNFNSVSESKVKTDSQASMMTSLFDTIKKNASSDVQDKLASEAETLAGIGGIPAPSSESNSISEFHQENELNVKLKNVVANVVERNTKDMNVQKCSQSVRNSQVLPVYDVNVGENVTIELIKMEQVTDAIMKCEMVKETSSKVVDQLVQELGLQVEDVSKTTKKTELKSKAKSSDALGEIGRGIGNMLTGFGMAGMIIPLIIGAVILIVLFKMIGGGGKGKSMSRPKKTGKKQKGGSINNMDPNTLMIIQNVKSRDLNQRPSYSTQMQPHTLHRYVARAPHSILLLDHWPDFSSCALFWIPLPILTMKIDRMSISAPAIPSSLESHWYKNILDILICCSIP